MTMQVSEAEGKTVHGSNIITSDLFSMNASLLWKKVLENVINNHCDVLKLLFLAAPILHIKNSIEIAMYSTIARPYYWEVGGKKS